MSVDQTTPNVANYVYTADTLVPTTHDFCVVQWIKVQAIVNLGTMWTIANPNDSPTEQQWENRTRTGGNEIQCTGNDGSNPTPTLQFPDATTLVGSWKVIITSWKTNGTSGDVWCAVNGEAITNHAESVTTFSPSCTSPEFRISVNRAATSGRVTDGNLGACVIYNRALTDLEQAAHFVSAEKGVYPHHIAENAILGAWMLDDTSPILNFGVALSETGTPIYDTAVNPTFINRITRHNMIGL